MCESCELVADGRKESLLKQALFVSIVFLACATPLTYWPQSSWLSFPFYDVGMGVVFSLFGLSLFVPRPAIPRLNTPELILGLFWIWVGLNAAIRGSWSAAKPLMDLLLLLFILAHADLSEGKIKHLLLALMTTGAVVASFGAYEYLYEHKLWVAATLLNPNTFSGYLCLLLPMSFCLWKVESPRLKLLGILITTVMAFGMTASFTRGGYIAVLVGMSGFALMKDKRLFLVILAYMIAFGFIVSEARTRFSSIAVLSNDAQPGTVKDTRATRIYLWGFAWQEFRASPLSGIGIGTFQSRLDKYLEDNPQIKGRFPNTSGPHNSYMKMLCELGLPGLVLFLAVLCSWIWKSGKALFSAKWSRADPWAAGVFWGLVSFLVHNLTNTLFMIIPCALAFWVSLGILARLAEGDACAQS
jgi:O-antigen ligase